MAGWRCLRCLVTLTWEAQALVSCHLIDLNVHSVMHPADVLLNKRDASDLPKLTWPMLGRTASLSCRALRAARISTDGSAGGRTPFNTFTMRDQAADTATCGQRRSQRLLARAGSAPSK